MNILISASPHLKGTSDTLAQKTLAFCRNQNKNFIFWQLAKERILPCLGCQRCGHSDSLGQCVLDSKDQGKHLLQQLIDAQNVIFFAPIYFYHLPGLTKNFLDRAQSFYVLWEKQKLQARPGRLKAVLVAGRSKGQKLFAGAELSLKYFGQIFNLEFSCLGLKGLNVPQEITPSILEQIFAFILD